MPPSQQQITRLLLEIGPDNRQALDQLLPLVYAELQGLAHHFLQGERKGHTLNTTALVHEAYLKLVDQEQVQWQNRAHFFAVAAMAIRRILVNYAKMRKRAKRGGGAPKVTLDGEAFGVLSEGRAEDLLALDEALERLARVNERAARVVECRFFGELSIEETAVALGISERTVKRDWTQARFWLYQHIKDDGETG